MSPLKIISLILGVLLLIFFAVLGGLYYKFSYAPKHVDFTGGSELTYALNTEQRDIELASVEKAFLREQQRDSNSARAKVLSSKLDALKAAKAFTPEKAVEIVRHRIDPHGLSGYRVEIVGDKREQLCILLPQLPKEEHTRIKTALNIMGRLTFHVVTDDASIRVNTQAASPANDGRRIYNNPADGIDYVKMDIERISKITGNKLPPETVVARLIPDMDCSHITSAAAKRDAAGRWMIEVQFDAVGSTEFAILTASNLRKRLALVIDGKAMSAPMIMTEISTTCQITGTFSKDEAEGLAEFLKLGLPCELRIVSERSIGASLGKDESKK